MVRNLSDFSFCYHLSVAHLCAKSGWSGSAFGGGFHLGLLLHGGLFCEHGFHTSFINFFTSSTSELEI